jgi:hypothetical protein
MPTSKTSNAISALSPRRRSKTASRDLQNGFGSTTRPEQALLVTEQNEKPPPIIGGGFFVDRHCLRRALYRQTQLRREAVNEIISK